MNEGINQQIAEAMAHLEATQAAVAKAEAGLRNATATARSRDRAVEATVGAQGQLTGVKFLDSKYQGMTATQLAASMMEAAEQARTKVTRQVMDTFGPLMGANPAIPGGRGIELDWAGIFGADAVGGRGGAARSAGDRLRDEIHEDDTDTSTGRSRA
ncbi:YbaB/EbfC family nucleoid-associated protein [Streptomyces sp. NPDC057456]|uniref:YbaB/EbfC family nucleoid-associated protein n=1 Tax=Streptomyces sp. NPDC057456 TaxID=3346139 RepID=UPI0036B4728E